MPLIVRVRAISALVITIMAIGIGFYLNRIIRSIRLKREHTQLVSKGL
jgi:hypothetical protein